MTNATAVPATSAMTPATPWWVVLLQGIFAALIGLLLLISPGATLLVLVQLLGFYWLIGGIFGIVSIFIDSSLWGWKLFAGILGILAGFAIIQYPLWSSLLVPATLVIFLGIEGLIIGVLNVIQAFQEDVQPNRLPSTNDSRRIHFGCHAERVCFARGRVPETI
jgi:uncharacterized membrane protein HdeD (DUF308 family)